MAVSPSDLKNNFLNECQEFEFEIDEKLKKHKFDGSSFQIHAPKNMSQEHFSAIKHRYLNVGWKNLSWIDALRMDDSNKIKFFVCD